VHYQQQVLAPVPRPDFGTGFCAQSTPNAILPRQAGRGGCLRTPEGNLSPAAVRQMGTS